MPQESLRQQSARLAEQLKSFVDQNREQLEDARPDTVACIDACVESLIKEIEQPS